MSINKNFKYLILTFCAIIILALFYISIARNTIVNIFSTVLSPVVSPVFNYGTIKNNEEIKLFKEENEKLRQENADLTEKLSLAETLLKDKQSVNQYEPNEKIAVKILWFNIFPGRRAIHINKGSADGLMIDMAVVAPGEVLVGKIVSVTENSADVLLIDDQTFKMSVLVGESLKESITGLFTVASDNTLSVSMVGVNVRVDVGTLVRTAGQGDLLPRNLTVGRVSEAVIDGADPFLKIKIEPLVDIKNQEYLFVINDR